MSSAYYGLLNCLSQDHITFLAGLEPRAFVYILESLSKGLSALGKKNHTKLFKILGVTIIMYKLDSTIYISCCSILDSIVSYIFKQLQLKGTYGFWFQIRISKIYLFLLLVSTFPNKKLRNITPENVQFLEVLANPC